MNVIEQKSQKIEAECKSFLTSLNTEFSLKPRIAAWGLVKAGKSSLLNMLSGHITNEYFKTGAVRTTRANSEIEKENYILVDTPGLGIDNDDSKQAFKGLDSADIILFVHSPQGELDQEEIELLSQIKKTYADETEQRLIMVVSLLDKDQNGSMDAISKKIQNQLQDFLGIQPKIFQISNTRYKKGVSEKKSTLTMRSGIPSLISHLDSLSVGIENHIAKLRKKRLKKQKLQILKNIDQQIEEELQFISSISKPYREKASAFNKIMDQLKSDLASSSENIKEAKKKIGYI